MSLFMSHSRKIECSISFTIAVDRSTDLNQPMCVPLHSGTTAGWHCGQLHQHMSHATEGVRLQLEPIDQRNLQRRMEYL